MSNFLTALPLMRNLSSLFPGSVPGRSPSFIHLDRAPELWKCARRVRDWWPTTRAYLRLSETKYPFDFRTRSGLEIELRDFYEVTTAWVVFCRDEYAVPPNAKTIVDLGANYGAFTLLAAAQAPYARIVSLEPFPSTFERLTANVNRNEFQERVRCWQLALAPNDGEQRMTGAPEVGSHLRHLVLRAGDQPATIGVQGISWRGLLARIRSELCVDEIDLVKMDIEGAEHAVIPDLPPDSFQGIKAWQMEYHWTQPKGPLFAALERAGLRCVEDRICVEDQGVARFERVV
jgi:FkbM family methyltransferase